MAAMADWLTVSGAQNSERGSLPVLKSFGPNSASLRRPPSLASLNGITSDRPESDPSSSAIGSENSWPSMVAKIA